MIKKLWLMVNMSNSREDFWYQISRVSGQTLQKFEKEENRKETKLSKLDGEENGIQRKRDMQS